MTASVASATSSSSLSSARDDGDWVVTGINTASPPLENVDDGPSHNVHHISSRSSISIFSSPSLYSLFSSLTFPIKFRTSFLSSVFLPLWVFLAVLVSPAFGEEWSLNCQQTLYFGALNGTATLQCRVTGVNLYSTELSLASIKWIKVRTSARGLAVKMISNGWLKIPSFAPIGTRRVHGLGEGQCSKYAREVQ